MGSLFKFRKEPSRKAYTGLSLASFGFIIILWCVLTYGKFIDPFFLPSPGSIITTIYDLFLYHNLLGDIGISVFRIAAAFLISAIIAIPLGIFMSCFRGIEAVTEPHINFIRYLPVPALVPLTILWVGIGESSKILLLFIGTFFQLILLVVDDSNNVPKEYIELGRTLGAKTGDIIRRVLLPAILPNLYDDLRVTLGWCWTYLLIGELVAARTGLGHLIKEAQRFAKPEVVISGILIIGIIGLVTDYSFKVGHKYLFPYLKT